MTALSSDCDPPLQAALAEWKKTVTAELAGVPFEKKLVTRTAEGIDLQPLYTRADLQGLRDLSSPPGSAPFLRGWHASHRPNRSWEIAQEILASSPADYNRSLRADLMQGQDSVVLNPDSATLAGLTAGGNYTTAAEAGLPLEDKAAFLEALAGVDLTAVPLHLRAGSDPRPLAALYLAAVDTNGFAFSALRGGVTADPLGEAARSGNLPANIDLHYDGMAAWTRWTSEHSALLRTIGVDVSFWGNAGATATQELAFALSTACDYLRGMEARDLSFETVCARLRFKFSIGSQFFTEIAKFRAFRLLWCRVLSAIGRNPREAAGAGISAATGRWNKTLLDPQVNLLRVTTEALSAILGGCDTLHIAPLDEITGKTSDFSRRIARNIHTLLAEEFGASLTADPAGGSWYLEKLTDDLARRAWQQFQDIEKRGGMAACLTSGYAQDLVMKTAEAKVSAVNSRRAALIGTNLFPNLKESCPVPTAPTNPNGRSAATANDHKTIRFSRSILVDQEANLISAIGAAGRGATAPQIARFFHGPQVEYVVIKQVASRRAAEGFETLRKASDAFATRTGARPKVFLGKMGPPAQHKARADFSSGFFSVAGFEMLGKQTFEAAEAAAQAGAASDAKIAVLCSTDDTYPVLVPTFAKTLKASRPDMIVVVAGLPVDATVAASFRAAGVDEFIHLRANACDLLAQFQKQIGATL